MAQRQLDPDRLLDHRGRATLFVAVLCLTRRLGAMGKETAEREPADSFLQSHRLTSLGAQAQETKFRKNLHPHNGRTSAALADQIQPCLVAVV